MSLVLTGLYWMRRPPRRSAIPVARQATPRALYTVTARPSFTHWLPGYRYLCVSEHDRILLLPSMFHANAWGLPLQWLVQGSFVMPGPHVQLEGLMKMIATERPTITAMVPTILVICCAQAIARAGYALLPHDRLWRFFGASGHDRRGPCAVGGSGLAGLGYDGDELRCVHCRTRPETPEQWGNSPAGKERATSAGGAGAGGW